MAKVKCERCRKAVKFEDLVRVVSKVKVVTSEYERRVWLCADCAKEVKQ